MKKDANVGIIKLSFRDSVNGFQMLCYLSEEYWNLPDSQIPLKYQVVSGHPDFLRAYSYTINNRIIFIIKSHIP